MSLKQCLNYKSAYKPAVIQFQSSINKLIMRNNQIRGMNPRYLGAKNSQNYKKTGDSTPEDSEFDD